MKTIAVSIDEQTLEALDRLVAREAGRVSRSEIVRQAVRALVEARNREEREEHESRVIARHRQLLAKQAAALVEQQALP